MNEPKKARVAMDVLREIEDKIASIDGIATRDAMQLGALIQEYGASMAGKATADFMIPMIDAMLKPKLPDEPWKKLG